jgi:cyclase
MLQPRLIPCLLLHNRGLVKTIGFKKPVYIGDPINAVRIFNEKEVDEIMLLDIDAARSRREPDYALLEDIASECFIPLCYGGGVESVEQMRKLYSLGIEKVSLCTAALERPELIEEAAALFGSQSVVVTLDVKKPWLRKRYAPYTKGGGKKVSMDVLEAAQMVVAHGAGELVINNIERDGTMQGYDLELLREVAGNVPVPVVALGGADRVASMAEAINETGVSAAAAGSVFVFRGPLRGVLINYPSYDTVARLFKEDENE